MKQLTNMNSFIFSFKELSLGSWEEMINSVFISRYSVILKKTMGNKVCQLSIRKKNYFFNQLHGLPEIKCF